MNAQEFAQFILTNLNGRMQEHIQTGAQWEIALQTDLWNLMIRNGFSAQREANYPGTRESLDILAGDQTHIYALELKCESGNNSGAKVISEMTSDAEKIQRFNVNGMQGVSNRTLNRWVVGVVYSPTAKQKLGTTYPTAALASDTRTTTGITVAVIPV